MERSRQELLALLHVRVSQLTWTNTSDPIADIQAGIERARCTGPDQRLAPEPALLLASMPALPMHLVRRYI